MQLTYWDLNSQNTTEALWSILYVSLPCFESILIHILAAPVLNWCRSRWNVNIMYRYKNSFNKSLKMYRSYIQYTICILYTSAFMSFHSSLWQYIGFRFWLQVLLFRCQRMVQNLDASGEEGGTESSGSFGMPSRTWSFGKQKNTLQRKRHKSQG